MQNRDKIAAAILFALFLSLYIYTAASSIYSGDSGELAAAVKTLGFAHSTGFPLYMLSGKLFALIIPFGDVAYRLNIFSALLTASAVALLFFLLRFIGIATVPAGLASAIFGLGRNTVWSNSGTVNVYALGLFLAIVLFGIFIKWQKTSDRKFLFLYAFTFGLSLGSHVILMAMVLPLLFMLHQEIERGGLKILLKAFVLTFLPILQYLYLWFAYVRGTIITRGDIGSFQGLIDYITQKDFANKIFTRTAAGGISFLQELFRLLGSEFLIPFFILALLGFFVMKAKTKPLLIIMTTVALANILIMFFYGDNQDLILLYRYIFLVYLVLTVFLAFSLNALFNRYTLHKNKAIFLSLLIIILLIIGLQAKSGFAANNKHNHFLVSDFAGNVLLSMEPNSILLTAGDTISGSLWYLQSAGQRNDVIHLSAELAVYDWYLKSEIKQHPDALDVSLLNQKQNYSRISDLIGENIGKRRVYTTFTAYDEYSNSHFDFVPVGIVYAVVLKGSGETKDLLQLNQALWSRYQLRDVKTGKYKDFMVDSLTRIYAKSLNNIGTAYFNYDLPKESLPFFEKSLEIFPNEPSVRSNLEKVKNSLLNNPK